MQIEIITTKKKLTKSLVSQMLVASSYTISLALEQNNVLGYVTGCHEQTSEIALIKGVNDYYAVPMYAWKPSGDNEAYVVVGHGKKRGTKTKAFDSKEKRDEFLADMKRLAFVMRGNHIYL